MQINQLLKHLMDKGGSDLHLLAGLPPAIRVQGQLEPIEGVGRLMPDAAKEIIYEILTDEQKSAFENDASRRYELDFAYSINGVGRFRFNVHKQRGSVGAVVRALATSIPNFEKLSLPPSLMKMTQAKKGLALVTGPTGSGKSTTLAAIIDKINETRADHIITIEDPIEYVHNSKKSFVMQREVGDAGDTLSFQNALKAALRQDPDVILIGELRDYETIGIAITSAETGHLVFGTLHTSSAAQTISRIIDVFPSDQVEQVKTQLAGNLFGVVSQVLLPTIDGKGRRCACEIMFTTSAVRNNIRQNNLDQIYQSIQTGLSEGMQTMDMAVAKFVRAREVTYEAAIAYIRDEPTKRALEPFAHSPGGKNGQQGMGQPAPATARPAPRAVPQAAPAEPDPPKRRLGGMDIPPWEKK